MIATLLVLRRERLLDGFLVLVAPAHRDRTKDVMEKIWVRLGGYLRAKVVVMVCVGLLMYVALRVLGVPRARCHGRCDTDDSREPGIKGASQIWLTHGSAGVFVEMCPWAWRGAGLAPIG